MDRDLAIRNTHPTVVTINVSDGGTEAWDKDGNVVVLNESLITEEMTKIQTEYDAQDYARKRAKEYPSLKEFAEAYTEKEIGADTTKWDEYVIKYNKVRSDNPKS